MSKTVPIHDNVFDVLFDVIFYNILYHVFDHFFHVVYDMVFQVKFFNREQKTFLDMTTFAFLSIQQTCFVNFSV